MRVIKKVFLYGFIFALIAILGAIVFSIVYQDKIVNRFVEEANKNLSTPIQVEKIKFSVLEKFPHMAIVLEDVYMSESIRDSKEPLGVMNKMYFTFSLYNLLRGKYVIDQVTLKDGKVSLRIDENGHLNYKVLKNNESTGGGDIKFDIDKITLDNIEFIYNNQRKKEIVDLLAKKGQARLSQNGELLDVSLNGDIFSNEIKIKELSYFTSKDVNIDAAIVYNLNTNFISISPSTVGVNNATFFVEGSYLIAENDEIKLKVDGKNANLQTIISLLPKQVANRLSQYESKGELYFDAVVEGQFGRNKSPGVAINFGSKNAIFIYPANKKRIENVFCEGTFTSPSIYDLREARLTFNDIKANLDQRPIIARLDLKNFNDYYIDCALNATVEAKSILDFFPIEALKSASGEIDLDITFKGKISDFRHNKNLDRIQNSGEINLQNLNFELKANTLKFKDLNGNFIFHSNNLAINDFQAKAGNSNFEFNGFFKNFLGQLLSEKQPMIIQAKLSSKLIDLDELLSSGIIENSSSSNGSAKYFFDITPRLNLQFDCDIDRLKFRRLRGKNIKGNLLVKNQKASTKNISFEAAGGFVQLTGDLNAQPKNDLIINTQVNVKGINIDSSFYIFENFNQNFLEDRHLKGQLDAQLKTKIAFNKNLQLYSNSLVADVETTIRNGELNNFEPMDQVAKYIRRESLDHLRFSEIKNNIHIENQIIYIPPMEVSSNVRTIQVQGTHTFNQLIKYNLKVPIRNPDKSDKDEAFGAIENDNNGNSNLYLTIIGSTSDYEVLYDGDAVKQKIKKDIKKEGQELKSIITNKGKKKETIELNEEEYFDFDSVNVNQ